MNLSRIFLIFFLLNEIKQSINEWLDKLPCKRKKSKKKKSTRSVFGIPAPVGKVNLHGAGYDKLQVTRVKLWEMSSVYDLMKNRNKELDKYTPWWTIAEPDDWL